MQRHRRPAVSTPCLRPLTHSIQETILPALHWAVRARPSLFDSQVQAAGQSAPHQRKATIPARATSSAAARKHSTDSYLAGAATVVEDRDDGSAREEALELAGGDSLVLEEGIRLLGSEEGGSHGGGARSLHDLLKRAGRARQHRRCVRNRCPVTKRWQRVTPKAHDGHTQWAKRGTSS